MIIPENFEIDTVEIFKKIKDDEEHSEECDETVCECQDCDCQDCDCECYSSDDDSDYMPEEEEEEEDIYEDTELTDKEKAILKKELQQLILDQEFRKFDREN